MCGGRPGRYNDKHLCCCKPGRPCYLAPCVRPWCHLLLDRTTSVTHALVITWLQTIKSSCRILRPQGRAIQINTERLEQLNFNCNGTLTKFSYQDISSKEHIPNFSVNIGITTHIMQNDVSQILEFYYELQVLPIHCKWRENSLYDFTFVLGREHHRYHFTQVHCHL